MAALFTRLNAFRRASLRRSIVAPHPAATGHVRMMIAERLAAVPFVGLVAHSIDFECSLFGC
jgi:hypothetical protein